MVNVISLSENESIAVLGDHQSRFTLYTDEESVCSLQSGLGTVVCAPNSHTNEMLLWPSSRG
jgi:hypothetical protein